MTLCKMRSLSSSRCSPYPSLRDAFFRAPLLLPLLHWQSALSLVTNERKCMAGPGALLRAL